MTQPSDTREFIADLLQQNPVVLFMKGNRAQPQCGFSAKTVAALDMLLPDYMAIDVLQHPALRDGIKAYGNWPTIPQLYVRGELVGGSDIVTGMFETGELAEVLEVPAPAETPPTITIEPAVADIMTNALKANAGMVVHLKIDAGWEHSLSLAPASSDGLRVECGAITLQLDPWSASRAEGLTVRVRESLQGQGFAFDNPNAPPPVQSMTVTELKAKLDAGDKPRLYDVRRDEERALASLSAATPWDESTMRQIDEMPHDTPLIFMCQKGGRSRSVAEHYRRRGYSEIYNLEGGIDAWSTEIDPSVPRY